MHTLSNSCSSPFLFQDFNQRKVATLMFATTKNPSDARWLKTVRGLAIRSHCTQLMGYLSPKCQNRRKQVDDLVWDLN